MNTNAWAEKPVVKETVC